MLTCNEQPSVVVISQNGYQITSVLKILCSLGTQMSCHLVPRLKSTHLITCHLSLSYDRSRVAAAPELILGVDLHLVPRISVQPADSEPPRSSCLARCGGARNVSPRRIPESTVPDRVPVLGGSLPGSPRVVPG